MLRIAYKFMTQAQKEFFNNKGFTVIPSYLTKEECQNAVKRIDQIIEEKVQTEAKVKFFHGVTEQQLRDSATTIELFYQKQSIKDGKFVRDKRKCVNKIAHNLHQLDPLFNKITYSSKAIDILKKLGYVHPAVPQSMAILKVPYDGSPVSIHQDSTYLITTPDTLLAFWIPLEKCTIENGCLQGLANKRQTNLYQQIKNGTMKQLVPKPDWQKCNWSKIEMQAGDLVIFDGKFVHKSAANLSDKSRYAYTWHLFDAGKSQWVDGNWIPKRKFIEYY